jgi:hypothetical protein
VIRATALSPSMPSIGGRCIDVEPDPLSNQASTTTVTGCLVEDHYDHGIFGASSDLVVDSTVVRNIETIPDGRFGRGINIQLDSELSHLPATATVTRTLVENTHEAGLVVLGASASVEQSTFRDPHPRPSDGWMGRGVMVQYAPGLGVPSYAGLSGVLVEGSYDSGVFVAGAQVALHDSVVRGTAQREADQLFGDGVTGVIAPGDTLVEVLRTVVEGSARAGVSGFSARLVLGGNRLECNGFDLAWQAFGAGGGLEDIGGNTCGCGTDEVACKATSSMLDAPTPLE